MKFDIRTGIIISLAIVIAFLLLTQPSPVNVDVIEYESRIARRDSTIHELSRKFEMEAYRRRQDSLSHIETMSKAQINQSRSEAIVKRLRANPVIIKVREEVPQVDSLLAAQDSIVSSQAVQLTIQSKYIVKLQGDIGEITADFSKRLKLTQEQFLDQKKIAEEYKKDLRKERRKGKLARVLIPIVGIGMFLLSSK